jgi:hypothetical protein
VACLNDPVGFHDDVDVVARAAAAETGDVLGHGDRAHAATLAHDSIAT